MLREGYRCAEMLILQPSKMWSWPHGSQATSVLKCLSQCTEQRLLTNMSVIMWKRLGNIALGYKLLEDKKKTEFIANSMCVWEHV